MQNMMNISLSNLYSEAEVYYGFFSHQKVSVWKMVVWFGLPVY